MAEKQSGRDPEGERASSDRHHASTLQLNHMNQQSKTALSDADESQPGPVAQKQDERYVTGTKLALIMTALCSTMFLVALDRTIIATAVPRITAEFHTLKDISWYASAYLITSCATQLLWGRIYTFYSTKTLFLVAIVVFEVGSVVCGAAPTSTAFIVGRAIAGTGSAGIFSGSTVILTHIVPLQRRPIYVGLMGSMFGISSIIGPLIGGAFTDRVTWRWCFYINLPIGAVVLAVLIPFLHVRHQKLESTLSRQLIRLDPLGTLLFLPAVVCFLLALQWGGTSYPWNSARVIALFVLAGVLIISFVLVQAWRKEDATTPPRIITQRSIACGALYAMCVGGGLITMLYSLPLWFQAVKGTSAVQSGIDTIPLVLGLVAGAIISGGIITATGYYVPWMFVSVVLMSVGAGLTTTFTVDTGSPAWIGYQALFGLGLGVGLQQPSLAAQTVLPEVDVSIGISIMFFSQSLGGAVFSSIGQSVFGNFLAQSLARVSGIDVPAVLAAGAIDLDKVVAAESLAAVLLVYNDSLRKAFIVAVAAAAAMVLPASGMEWRTIKKGNTNIPAT
ncbi:Uu.00g140380.m01.CDS01 [Anthostomella pinea]|uniref:Uu.00g140380.m01.CDS01 n=1 Tax=Anthostomella pinea TaxID=933095 RepID=A0AAI8VR93_9PEZI|nr:Uu.00g140380.m01.CDS01 [Anthostomella pinea]